MPTATEFVDISSDKIVVDLDCRAAGVLELMFQQTEEVNALVQQERKRRFLNGEPVYEYTVQDAADDLSEEVVLPDKQLRHIEGLIDVQWNSTYTGLVESVDRSRWQPDDPVEYYGRMGREESVAWYEGTNDASDTTTVHLSTEDMTPFITDDGPAVEIHFTDDLTAVFQVDQEVSQYIAQFDSAGITYLSDEAVRGWRQLGIDYGGNTTMGFYYHDTPRMYSPAEVDSDTYANHLSLLRSIDSLDDPGADEAISEVVNGGYFSGDDIIDFARLLIEKDDRVAIDYGYHAPLITDEIARITDVEMHHIPQEGMVILDRTGRELGLERFEEAFPQKQYLTDSDRREVVRARDPPWWAAPEQSYDDDHRAYEAFANMFDAGEFDEMDAVGYYITEWVWFAKPEDDAIHAAVEYGRDLIDAVERYDAEHGTEYGDCFKWPRGKLFADLDRYYWRDD